MGILKDILDIFNDVDGEELINSLSRKRTTSISKRSLDGTMQFPVLVSRSLDIDSMTMIMRSLERQYGSFIQTVLTMNPDADIKKGIDSYLRQFHTNSDTKYNFNDYTSSIAKLKENSYEITIESSIFEAPNNILSSENKRQLRTIFESLNMDILNNKFTPKNYDLVNMEYLSEAKGRQNNNHRNNQHNNRHNNHNNNQRNTPNSINMISYNNNFSDGSTDVNHTTTVVNRNERLNITRSDFMDTKTIHKDILRDNDVKKANELVPMTLHIRVLLTNKEKERVGSVDFVLGVKATMHPIKSDEMVKNIVNGCNKRGKFFNFIRWTTGEISFVKDFLLNIKDIKSDVTNRSQGASHWWIALKRRKALASFKDRLFIPNGPISNASLVITSDEAEYIKTNFGHDLLNESVAYKLMKEYFLLAVVIVDNSTQMAHFLFDGQQSFQTVTFDGLKRENSSKNDMNEVIRLANKLRN